MKTILVVYTHTVLSESEWRSLKQYAFNTEAKVKVGDLLSLDAYNTPVQVIAILDKRYNFVNTATGVLTLKRDNSTRCYPLRLIKVTKPEKQDGVILATRIK